MSTTRTFFSFTSWMTRLFYVVFCAHIIFSLPFIQSLICVCLRIFTMFKQFSESANLSTSLFVLILTLRISRKCCKPIFFSWVFQFIYWKSYVLWTFFHRLDSMCIWYHFFSFFKIRIKHVLFKLYVRDGVYIYISLNICVCLWNWIESFFFVYWLRGWNFSLFCRTEFL